MESNNYRSVTPLKKKRRKITSTAALILCIIVFFVGILCGKGFSSGKKVQELTDQISQMELDHKKEVDRLKTEISGYNDVIKDLESKLAQKTLDEQEEVQNKTETTPEESKAKEDKSQPPEDKKPMNGVMRVLIIIILVIVIIVCLLVNIRNNANTAICFLNIITFNFIEIF